MSNAIAITTAAALSSTRKLKKVRRLSTSGNITERECTTSVTERVKYYDKACKGLYVDLSPTSPATFWVKCTTREGKQRPIKVGRFHPTELNVDKAREIAAVLKTQVSMGQDIVAERQAARAVVRDGKTVDEVIELRIAYIQELEPRKSDGVLRPRRKDWKNTKRFLEHYISPRLGTKMVRNVTRQDIVDLDEAIHEGKLILKDGTRCQPSDSNRRHMRCVVSSMFKWAAQKGFMDASPCVNLPELDYEAPKDRVLSEDEIRTLWHGLDRDDLPVDRRTLLAIKATLATMLRSWELLGASRTELAYYDGFDQLPCLDIDADRVKKGRIINQPLTALALEIVKESMGNHKFIFGGRWDDEPVARTAMGNALRGRKEDGRARAKGICELLGLAPFTPHDLRRTAATLAGRKMGDLPAMSDQMIEYCLDHQKESRKSVGVYNRAERKHMAEKRQVLENVEAKLRRIISQPMRQQLAA